MDDDLINMRLLEIERVHYDARADVLVAVALDDETSPRLAARLMREARTIFRRTVVCVRRVVGRPPHAEPSIVVQLDAQSGALEGLVDDLADLAVALWREGKLDWSGT